MLAENPDTSAAQRHLLMLTGEDDPIIDLQVFCDADKSRRDLARSMRGRFSTLMPDLVKAQQDGCGVFVALNQTDGSGRRKKENITAARVVFLDLDGSPLPDAWPEQPAMIMRTSSPSAGITKYQCWWPIEPTDDLDGWVAFQKFLAEKYGGDLKCALTTQVGRLAGFWHQKNPDNPHRVEIIAHDGDYGFGEPIPLRDLAATFGFDLDAVVSSAPERQRIEEPEGGWDHKADVDRARAFASDPDNWKPTSDGGVSIFRMACALRDFGVSPETAIEIIMECVPTPISDTVIEQKVANAYRYASGDAGERSMVTAVQDFAAEPLDEADVAAANEVERNRRDRFKRWSLTELMDLPPPEWLVDGLVTEGGLVQIYGARKTNKTFVTLDMALCVATGRPFHSIEVKQGRVTYVIGEGGPARFGDRILAWCKHNAVDPKDLDGRFGIVPMRVGVDNERDLKDFLDGDREPCALTVFDTLARSMDGDENSTHDMNKAVKGLDRVREHFGGAVIVVHHAGKDEGKKGRGSTVLPGAVDATLRVSRNTVGHTVLTVEEIRDAESGKKLVFEPKQVIIDVHDLRASLAMQAIDAPAPRAPRNANDKVLVAVAEQGGVSARADLINQHEEGMSRANVHKAVAKLVGLGLLLEDAGGCIRVSEAGIEQASLLGAVVPDEDEEW